METSDLAKRMKRYEAVSKTTLVTRMPVILRIDGKAFHTLTRGFQKPFDRVLNLSMMETMRFLCKNIQGCVLGYTQSDEITLVLVDYKKLTSNPWFDYEVQKMCSVGASMATVGFNNAFARRVEEFSIHGGGSHPHGCIAGLKGEKMAVKILITQALDERDLLVKKINKKIEKTSFADIMKAKEERVMDGRMEKNEYTDMVKSSYQQICDLILRFQRLDEAILVSNANTMIHTTIGEMSISSAISLRNKMKKGIEGKSEEMDFETLLQKELVRQYLGAILKIKEENKVIQEQAKSMRKSISGKNTPEKDEKAEALIMEYVKENTVRIVDPLNIKESTKEAEEKQKQLLKELDRKIKFSNATTYIEV